MYIGLYKFEVRPGKEQEFVQTWQKLSEEMREKFNSFGSSLHVTNDYQFTATTFWRSREQWEKFWLLKEQVMESLTQLNTCLETSSETEGMQLIYTNVKYKDGDSVKIKDREFAKIVSARDLMIRGILKKTEDEIPNDDNEFLTSTGVAETAQNRDEMNIQSNSVSEDMIQPLSEDVDAESASAVWGDVDIEDINLETIIETKKYK